MNWLLKRLGYRDRQYRGDGFTVRIEPMGRESLYVNYQRDNTRHSFDGQYIGSSWEGIEASIPEEVDPGQALLIAQDLKSAFEAMSYGYLIVRKTGVEIVAEPERQAAMEELQNMGYNIEILGDGKLRQTRREGAPRQDSETIRKSTPRMMALLRAIHGKRQRYDILAKSKEF
jgi:hypothetical protein